MKENLGKHNGAEWMQEAKTWIEETYKSNGELKEFIYNLVTEDVCKDMLADPRFKKMSGIRL